MAIFSRKCHCNLCQQFAHHNRCFHNIHARLEKGKDEKHKSPIISYQEISCQYRNQKLRQHTIESKLT